MAFCSNHRLKSIRVRPHSATQRYALKRADLDWYHLIIPAQTIRRLTFTRCPRTTRVSRRLHPNRDQYSNQITTRRALPPRRRIRGSIRLQQAGERQGSRILLQIRCEEQCSRESGSATWLYQRGRVQRKLARLGEEWRNCEQIITGAGQTAAITQR
jgi:hypothetical protein